MNRSICLLPALACLLACLQGPDKTTTPRLAHPQVEQAGPALPGMARAALYRSADRGQTWAALPTNLPMDTDVTFLEKRGPQLLLATENNGLFLSDTKGQDWKQIGSALPEPKITALHLAGTAIYAGVYQKGIYVSHDEGAHWTSLNSDLPDLRVRAIATTTDGTLLVATDRGIFRRSAEQDHWTAVFSEGQVISLNQEGGKLVAGAVTGVLLSEDQGLHWRRIHREGAAHNTALLEGHIVVMNISGDLFLSEDWGKSWRKAVYLPRAGSYVYEMVKAGDHLVMSNNYGLHRSADWGRTWTLILPTEELVFNDFVASGDTLFAGTRSWNERRGKKN
jgi:photosystem II stability/assembly factor-like uncharacterized protein